MAPRARKGAATAEGQAPAAGAPTVNGGGIQPQSQYLGQMFGGQQPDGNGGAVLAPPPSAPPLQYPQPQQQYGQQPPVLGNILGGAPLTSGFQQPTAPGQMFGVQDAPQVQQALAQVADREVIKGMEQTLRAAAGGGDNAAVLAKLGELSQSFDRKLEHLAQEHLAQLQRSEGEFKSAVATLTDAVRELAQRVVSPQQAAPPPPMAPAYVPPPQTFAPQPTVQVLPPGAPGSQQNPLPAPVQGQPITGSPSFAAAQPTPGMALSPNQVLGQSTSPTPQQWPAPNGAAPAVEPPPHWVVGGANAQAIGGLAGQILQNLAPRFHSLPSDQKTIAQLSYALSQQGVSQYGVTDISHFLIYFGLGNQQGWIQLSDPNYIAQRTQELARRMGQA